jgi:hypothetical protein
MAMTIDDVLSRRTRATLRRAEAAATAAPEVADLLAGPWGRDPRDTRLEAAAYAAEVHRDLARAGLGVGGPAGHLRPDGTHTDGAHSQGARADEARAGRPEPAS